MNDEELAEKLDNLSDTAKMFMILLAFPILEKEKEEGELNNENN